MSKLRAYDPNTDAAGVPPELADLAFDEGVALDSPLNFEQRILYPSRFPVLEGNGQTMTHLMQTAEVDMDGQRTPIAYPSVVYQDGKLVELEADAAFDHAMKTGEFRKFSSPEAAQMYSEGLYKRDWGKGDQANTFMSSIRGEQP